MNRQDPSAFPAAVHAYYTQHVDNADAKTGALLVLSVAAGGALLGRLPAPNAALAASSVALAFWAVSVGACLHALFPRLPGRSNGGLVFWEDVHTYPSADDYATRIRNLTDDDVEAAWAKNAYHVAGVLHRKFWGVRIALIAAVLGFAAAGISLPLR